MGALWSMLFGRTIIVNGESYKVIRNIGEGGFSYVDLVRDRQGHVYAVKQVLLQVEDQRTALDQEIRIHNTVTHSNVLKLIDSEIIEKGNGDAQGYLVFPYYQNGTLQDEIERMQNASSFIKEHRILQLFLSVCRGLYAMHNSPTESLAHRDIKPGNLLLSDDKNELILMDLGSASNSNVVINNRQEAISLQEHCAQTCTALYRAPELFDIPSQCTITVKSDVWSIGCSIYTAAFGTSPVDGSALAAVSGRIMFPRTHPYSQEFCNLIKWILRVDPSERPTVIEVEHRISTLLSTDNNDV